MEMCARCHKRVAVVYVTKIENGETVTEGICLKCARELGIKPVNDILDKMGVSPEAMEELEQMQEEMTPEELEGGAPVLDIDKIFRDFGLKTDGPKNPSGLVYRAGDGKPASGRDDSLPGDAASDEKPMQHAEEEEAARANDAARAENDPRRAAGRQTKKKYLPNYAQNLSDKAAEGRIDAIVGRERELERVIQILARRQKNNPCLIGEPGVGKTAIAEALALKIHAGDVPDKLKDKELYLLDLASLVAGTQFRGQFESRMNGLLNEVKEAGNVILVIDEVHNLSAAGDAEGAMNAANIMKPALSRGDIQVIGATTLNEYRKHIEKDSALERRFQPVIVDEPSVADSVAILKGIKHYYENYHQVKISDEIAERAVILSERYISDRFLPDKAIDLIDEAAASVSIHSTALQDVTDVSRRLEGVKAQRELLEAAQDDDVGRWEKIADLRTKELQLADQVKEASDAAAGLALTEDDLARVIEIWTGIPASSVTESEFRRLDKLEERIKSHIIGQDKAVNAVVRAIKRRRAGVSAKRKPVSFIFAGPTGVGKTELVKTIASDLFHSPDALIRLDMSEFMEKHAASKLIGSPPGYVGYDEAGQLTEKIRRHPYSVILFDEIEKAHPDVLNMLLQILDDGKLTDSHGKAVNFENTIIVMTTNAGSSVGSASAGFGGTVTDRSEQKTEKALAEFLRPEFLNRVDEIITFRPLEEEDFGAIARIMLEELKTALAEKPLKLVYTDAAVAYIAKKAFSRQYGARNLRRLIQTEIEDVIASELISRYENAPEAVGVDSDGESLKFDYL